MSQGKFCVSGPIQVLNFSYFETEFAGTFQTAVQIRDDIAARGWNKVVAFQTRNPMHLAHEELCRMAMERLGADGIAIHMLLGKLKRVSSLNLFVDKGGGDYEATTPEGFVAITGDRATKLVDRMEFSRLNFTLPKNW